MCLLSPRQSCDFFTRQKDKRENSSSTSLSRHEKWKWRMSERQYIFPLTLLYPKSKNCQGDAGAGTASLRRAGYMSRVIQGKPCFFREPARFEFSGLCDLESIEFRSPAGSRGFRGSSACRLQLCSLLTTAARKPSRRRQNPPTTHPRLPAESPSLSLALQTACTAKACVVSVRVCTRACLALSLSLSLSRSWTGCSLACIEDAKPS